MDRDDFRMTVIWNISPLKLRHTGLACKAARSGTNPHPLHFFSTALFDQITMTSKPHTAFSYHFRVLVQCTYITVIINVPEIIQLSVTRLSKGISTT